LRTYTDKDMPTAKETERPRQKQQHPCKETDLALSRLWTRGL